MGHVKTRQLLIPYLIDIFDLLLNWDKDNPVLITALIKKGKDLVRLIGGIK